MIEKFILILRTTFHSMLQQRAMIKVFTCGKLVVLQTKVKVHSSDKALYLQETSLIHAITKEKMST